MNAANKHSEPTQNPGSTIPKILRLPEVMRITTCSRSAIYSKISQGQFPKSIALGERAIGWLESEIKNWIEQRIKARG